MKPAGHPAGKTRATPGIAPAGDFGPLGEDPARMTKPPGNNGAPRPFLRLRAQPDTGTERHEESGQPTRRTSETEPSVNRLTTGH